MNAHTRRRVRILLYVVFSLALATTVLNLFLAGPSEIGIPSGILAVVLGGLLDSGYPWRKR
jgi:uncharacterized membrane protein